MSWGDRTIGVVLGLAIGITAVVLFVLFGSGETIDDPALNEQPAPDPIERPEPTP